MKTRISAVLLRLVAAMATSAPADDWQRPKSRLPVNR